MYQELEKRRGYDNKEISERCKLQVYTSSKTNGVSCHITYKYTVMYITCINEI
jgi:hypothetical protein